MPELKENLFVRSSFIDPNSTTGWLSPAQEPKVSPGSLSQDHLVQGQIGNCPAEASVLGLQIPSGASPDRPSGHRILRASGNM
jgi:hypothetical protein